MSKVKERRTKVRILHKEFQDTRERIFETQGFAELQFSTSPRTEEAQTELRETISKAIEKRKAYIDALESYRADFPLGTRIFTALVR